LYASLAALKVSAQQWLLRWLQYQQVIKKYRLNLAISLAVIVLTAKISNGDQLRGVGRGTRSVRITERNASEARKVAALRILTPSSGGYSACSPKKGKPA